MDSNETRIVFLHGATSVPAPVMEDARRRVPAGWSMLTLDEHTDPAVRREQVAGVRYLIVYGVGFDDLDLTPDLRLLQLLSAGYDRIDVNALKRAGIPVADNGGANAPTVAEHAVLLMLAVYKKLPMHQRALEQGRWLGLTQALSMRELGGKQVGIVGFGRIGQGVARIVDGFGARVIYCDEREAPPEVASRLQARRVSMEALLSSADVVTLHTPLTASTRRIIDAAALARMKPSAILVNTARGPVVDEAALVAALDAGTIAGAGLDVFEKEPIDASHPVLNRDNVVLTPHTAGTTIDTWTRRLDFAFENIARIARGEAPLSVVNA